MKRAQLFEFHDLSGFPHNWRNFLTDFLACYIRMFNPYGSLTPRLKSLLEKLGCRRLVDLCSGASGPALHVQELLSHRLNYDVEVTLTDKYPNAEAFRQAAAKRPGRVNGLEHPVDALAVPSELRGFRTLFASLHHFPPPMAQRILADAARRREGIGVFEFTERRVHAFLVMLLAPVMVLLLTPFVRPFRWDRLLWTYIIPIMPLVALWDGQVSNMRTYSLAELKELTRSIEADGYTWEVGQVSYFPRLRATYLFGYPAEQPAGQD
ncbi:MAG: hypothetical protein ACRD4D_05000 [Candidatus Acidiferrales bacterium]